MDEGCGGLRVVVLCPSSRNGECVLISYKDKWLVIDSFELKVKDSDPLPAAEIFLKSLDVKRTDIQKVIVSHAHLDHVQGLTRLLQVSAAEYTPPFPLTHRSLRNRQIEDDLPKLFTDENEKGEAKTVAHELRTAQQVAGSLLRRPNARDAIDSQWKYTFLWPPDEMHAEDLNFELQPQANYPNGVSTVLRFDLCGHPFILTGDVDTPALDLLAANDKLHLDFDLIKLAHHASDNGISKDFFEKHARKGSVALFAPNKHLNANPNNPSEWSSTRKPAFECCLDRGMRVFGAMPEAEIFPTPKASQVEAEGRKGAVHIDVLTANISANGWEVTSSRIEAVDIKRIAEEIKNTS